HAFLEDSLDERRGSENPASGPESKLGRVSLELRHVFRGQLVEHGRIDQDELFYSLGASGSKAQRDVAAQIDSHENAACYPQGGHRGVKVLRLRRNAEIRIERPVRFSVSEKIYGVGGMAGIRYSRGDVSPEKAGSGEPVYKDYGGPAVSVPLHVHRSGAHRNAELISLHIDTSSIAFCYPCRPADKRAAHL